MVWYGNVYYLNKSNVQLKFNLMYKQCKTIHFVMSILPKMANVYINFLFLKFFIVHVDHGIPSCSPLLIFLVNIIN